MTPAIKNPFSNDRDRRELWELVVRREIEAFLARDWSGLKRDFIENDFFGIDGRRLTSIDSWLLTFPTLESYGREWRKQAAEYTRRFQTGLREALYGATELSNIEIVGEKALIHKKFNGWLAGVQGQRINLQWQTLYVCRKVDRGWKIASFAGYLPDAALESEVAAGEAESGSPTNAWQHIRGLSNVSALKSLLVEIEQFQQSRMTGDKRQWLERARALLGADLQRSANYVSLAKKLGVSYEVFRHRFRRMAEVSPHRYRQSKVIERAAELLRVTQRTLAEIATDLGFCDEFHFSRLFKKVHGQSPSKFRRDHRMRQVVGTNPKQPSLPTRLGNPLIANPFSNDPDRHELWDIIVRRTIEAFSLEDWNALKGVFIEQGFFGIDGRLQTNIDSWRLSFSTLAAYQREWLKQAAECARHFKLVRNAAYNAMKLQSIDIKGSISLVHMKLDWGLAEIHAGQPAPSFQTLWICRKINRTWKIAGFVGYLPSVSVATGAKARNSKIPLPTGLWQHVNTLSDISALKSRLTHLERSLGDATATSESRWLEKACALLCEDFSAQASYPALALKLGLTYEVFRRRFRHLTGMSPHHYRQLRKVDHACQTLATTQQTVAEVAGKLGFCSPFHFSRTFKKITGESPTLFRRNVLAHL